MKKIISEIFITLLFFLITAGGLFPQNKPLLYFCERYDKVTGEVGQSATFTPGQFTVMVKGDKELGLDDVSIQIDSYNSTREIFTFYREVKFKITPDMKYIYFSNDDIRINEPGVYRVYLLDSLGRAVTHGVIIIKSY
ncbi:MAG: hypothetical protein JW917_06355 [Ignavibacteria bacterium]|nr:hypothetical protein [Ignavibacteria bacterium]